MCVKIRKMTKEEFDSFYQWSIAYHAQELMEQCHMSEGTAGRKQSFVCDLTIWELNRRRGYGKAALHLAETQAVEAGCLEIVLFVAEITARQGRCMKNADIRSCSKRVMETI